MPRFRSRRTVGLLGYLVAERRPLARERLAALFWPDVDPSKGRANLSRELHNLIQVLTDCWELDCRTVSFVPTADTSVDIYSLLKLGVEERWGEAVDLLSGVQRNLQSFSRINSLGPIEFFRAVWSAAPGMC